MSEKYQRVPGPPTSVVTAPVICPPKLMLALLVVREAKRAGVAEVITPPVLAYSATLLGFCNRPTSWAVPLRSRVAPLETDKFCWAPGAPMPGKSVLSPAFSRVVPPVKMFQKPPRAYCRTL